jgi:hypothetical protein
MPRMRDRHLSKEDRKFLNTRVINGKDVKRPDPENTKYATYTNEKRANLNASVF